MATKKLTPGAPKEYDAFTDKLAARVNAVADRAMHEQSKEVPDAGPVIHQSFADAIMDVSTRVFVGWGKLEGTGGLDEISTHALLQIDEEGLCFVRVRLTLGFDA